ncbi:hypothetical protein JL720_12556 [Aureococcus anophagefferens]|nr:hypothetical protein JL720_12556 [Aureococcus anophagefferens]
MDGHADSELFEAALSATVGLRECALKGGKWYYEITILDFCSVPQFGWALSGLDPTSINGCGDDGRSYACDGDRSMLWGPGANWSTERHFFPNLPWKVGDVVGSRSTSAARFQHLPDGCVAVDRAAEPAAEPPPPAPKPLTGAAALLETLDKFKAQNGGVDDPYYACMRSALEELEIEEREEGS